LCNQLRKCAKTRRVYKMLKEVIVCDYCNSLITDLLMNKIPYGTVSILGTILVQQSIISKTISTPEYGLHFCSREHLDQYILHKLIEGDSEVSYE
jgi:hypothetical protein